MFTIMILDLVFSKLEYREEAFVLHWLTLLKDVIAHNNLRYVIMCSNSISVLSEGLHFHEDCCLLSRAVSLTGIIFGINDCDHKC